MVTWARPSKENSMQFCTECKHFRESQFIIKCPVKDWFISRETEVFFYDPDADYKQTSIHFEFSRDIWEHSILCDRFKGEPYRVTEISCSAPNTVKFMNGSSIKVGTKEYNISARTTTPNPSLIEEINVSFTFGDNPDSQVYKWLQNLVL